MRCIYCGTAEQTNDHACITCGAPKAQSPEGLMWPYRLPRDEAEKAQLDAETLRYQVRLQYRQMHEREIEVEDQTTRNFALFLLVMLFLLPLIMNIAARMFMPNIF